MFGHQNEDQQNATVSDDTNSTHPNPLFSSASLGTDDSSNLSSTGPTSAPVPDPSLSSGTDHSLTSGMPNVDQAIGSTDVSPSTDAANDELMDIKQHALQQLNPLLGHLDQTPEEKFRTTMMMIQGADDQSLIKSAFEAAQQIKDEKTRAQALLAVVNEINYFTQHSNSD